MVTLSKRDSDEVFNGRCSLADRAPMRQTLGPVLTPDPAVAGVVSAGIDIAHHRAVVLNALALILCGDFFVTLGPLSAPHQEAKSCLEAVGHAMSAVWSPFSQTARFRLSVDPGGRSA